METEVGPSIISIVEFLLSAHHTQAKSTLQDLFRRLIFLDHGNHFFRRSRQNIVQFKHVHHHYLDLNPLIPKNFISRRFQIPKRAPSVTKIICSAQLFSVFTIECEWMHAI